MRQGDTQLNKIRWSVSPEPNINGNGKNINRYDKIEILFTMGLIIYNEKKRIIPIIHEFDEGWNSKDHYSNKIQGKVICKVI